MTKLLYNEEKLNLKAGQVIRILVKPDIWHSGSEKFHLDCPLNLRYPLEGRIVKIVITGKKDSHFTLEYYGNKYGFSLFDTDIQALNDTEMSII